jgi:uncharacterized protein YuzE
MKVSYDPVSDVMYLYFSKKKSTKTIEVEDGLNVDYAGKSLVGIEVLDASKKLNKKGVENVTFTLPTYKGITAMT